MASNISDLDILVNPNEEVIDSNDLSRDTGITIVYFYSNKRRNFTRKIENVPRLMKGENSNVYLRYIDDKGNICTSPKVTRVYINNSGPHMIFFADKTNTKAKRKIASFRVIADPKFYVLGETKPIDSFEKVKVLVNRKKKVSCVFYEGSDTKTTTPYIKEVFIPEDPDMELGFKTMNGIEYLIV